MSAPHASNFYFNEPLSERLNERQDSTASSVSNKSVENPLLGRNPQSLINATTITTTTTRDAATTTTVASHEANLRQRRRPTTGVTFLDDKENHNFPSNSKPVQQSSGMMTPPPLASVSLGTAMEGTFGLGSSYMPRTATYMGVRDRICLPSFSKIILVQLSSSLLSFSSSLFLYLADENCFFLQSATTVEATTNAKSQQAASFPSKERNLGSSKSNCWVLVFGYATAEQYQELLERFSRHGHVVDHCGLCQPGLSNWIAIQYANELEAKKALCHSPVKLSNNIYCGVKPLSDDDAILLHNKNSVLLDNGGDLWGQGGSALDTNGQDSFAATQHRPPRALTENDILLSGQDKPTNRDSNICNRLLRWILGIPQYD